MRAGQVTAHDEQSSGGVNGRSAGAQTHSASFQAFNAELQGQSIGPGGRTAKRGRCTSAAGWRGGIVTADRSAQECNRADAGSDCAAGSGQLAPDSRCSTWRMTGRGRSGFTFPPQLLNVSPPVLNSRWSFPAVFRPFILRWRSRAGMRSASLGPCSRTELQRHQAPGLLYRAYGAARFCGQPAIRCCRPRNGIRGQAKFGGALFTIVSDLVRAHIWW